MDFQQEINQLKDTLVVMAEIQRRQTEAQKMQTEGLAQHEERRRHIEVTLSQIGDKLNSLIGFMDGFYRKP